jgi:hypothetical protein
MKKDLFLKKAKEMGDFYVYYTWPGKAGTLFSVCTYDLNNKYITKQLRNRTVVHSDEDVLLWNWRFNNILVLPYKNIKKLVPLSTVLKNG